MTTLKIGQCVKEIIKNINNNFTELFNRSNVKYKVLYNGSKEIPSHSSGSTVTISLNDNPANYDGIIIQREGTGAWEYFGSLAVGTVLKVVNPQGDFTEMMEGLNLYECNCEILSNKQMKLNNNVYSGISTSHMARYIDSFSEVPLTKVIGIKIN